MTEPPIHTRDVIVYGGPLPSLYTEPVTTEPGAYEVRIAEDGTELHSGLCAAGDGFVYERDPFVIRYSSLLQPGGIFHARCAPTGAEWYGVEEDEDDEC